MNENNEDMRRFLRVMKEAAALRHQKLEGYGVAAYKTHGPRGIAMRLFDKVSRINNFYRSYDPAVLEKTESVRDTFIDIVNYAVMGVMVLDEQLKDHNTESEKMLAFDLLWGETVYGPDES